MFGLILLAFLAAGTAITLYYWGVQLLILSAGLWFLFLATRSPLFAIGGALVILLPLAR